MTDFGCACCKRRTDCVIDPSICQEYEHDGNEAIKVLVSRAVADVSDTFRRVSAWPEAGKVNIRVSVSSMPGAQEKQRLLRAIAAQLTTLNAEHDVLADGNGLVITFEELATGDWFSGCQGGGEGR